jgi:hypothetical protein
MVPKSCPANPRTEWALRGAGPATFSLTAVRAARAARGTLWPLAPPPYQVGSKPAGRGSFGRHTETPAAGRGLNWSRRGQGQPFKLSSGPCRLHLKRKPSGSGLGSACGPGASPAPPPPQESARDAPRTRKCRWAARLGCNGARWSTRSSTAVTTYKAWASTRCVSVIFRRV